MKANFPCSAVNFSILTLTLISGAGVAAGSYTTPRTEWGAPDLQGLEFFLQHAHAAPLQYGDRQFLNAAEIAELEARSGRETEASDAAIPGTGVDEAYNDFWIESAGLGQED